MVRGCTLLRVLEAERLALICSVAFSGDHLQLKELLLIGDAILSNVEEMHLPEMSVRDRKSVV